MKATEVTVTPPRILIYGDYGTGKTYLLGLIHENLKKVSKGLRLFDFDLSQTLTNHKFDVDIGPAFGYYVDKGFDALKADLSAYATNTDGFGGFAIDSLTTLQASVMRWVQSKFPQVKRPLNFIPGQQDWGVLIEVFNQLLPQLQKLSVNTLVALTAHIRRAPDSTGSIEIPLPAIAGKTLPSAIGAWFTEVWKTEVKSAKEYLVQIKPDYTYKCKTQLDTDEVKLPAEDAARMIVELTMQRAKGLGQS